MDDKLLEALKNLASWVLPSSLGVATKLSYDSRVKTLTRKQIVTSMIMACFVGFICDKLCTKYGQTELRGVIVAIGALGSEPFVQWLLKMITEKRLGIIAQRLFKIPMTEDIDESGKKEEEKKDSDTKSS